MLYSNFSDSQRPQIPVLRSQFHATRWELATTKTNDEIK